MSNQNIDIPIEVIHALEEVRSESKYNMYGSTNVVRRMSELGHHKAFLWMIDEHRLNATGDVRVDNEKYMTALIELGSYRALIDDLS